MPKSAKGLQNHFDGCSRKIQDYFNHFSFLLGNSVPYEIIIAYMFQRIEYAQRMSVYCSIIKRFKTDIDMTYRAVFSWDMKREDWQKIIELILNKKFPDNAVQFMRDASESRDKAMHGKDISEQDKRTGIASVLDYAKGFNEFFLENIGVEPFGKLQGWAGKGGGGEKINKDATRFVLKGLGLPLQ